VPHDLAPILQADRATRVMVYNEVGQLGFVRFNFLHPPFNDVRARRAVLLGLNQQEYMEALVGSPDFFQICRSVYSCGSPYETQEGVPPVDLAAARRLLRESGYDGRPVVQLHATNSATIGPISEVGTRTLRNIGFNVDVRAMDFQTFTRQRLVTAPPAEGGWNIAHSTWTGPDVVDPVVNISLSGAGRNALWGWPDFPEMEALRDRFAREADPAARRRIAAEIQKLNYEQVIHIPTGTFRALAAYRTNVTGLLPAPALMLWNVAKR
jgi:peptide/nickel transport system substrate-binding protein